MNLTIKWSRKCPRTPESFTDFVQRMANRLMVGEWRYGAPDPRQRYMSRMVEEVKAYKQSGNSEHLMNIANYAWLESVAPEHPRNHFNAYVPSATRHRFGGERQDGD